MEVTLFNYTPDAERLLIFAKRTRRMDPDVGIHLDLSDEERQRELDYILHTISGPWEFIDYTFFISGVTRAFTHQFVRHRVGTSFAQESTRIADKSDFEYLDETNEKNTMHYRAAMAEIRYRYKCLIDKGIPIQNARGILPINMLTNITAKFNLRSLNTLMNVRLCVRASGEFQRVAWLMRREVLRVHPWTEPVLLPFCMEWGSCKFQNFNECPIKIKFPWLQKDSDQLHKAKNFWSTIIGESIQPK